MSGYGRPGTRIEAEQCRTLDVNRWMREKIISDGIVRFGWWSWMSSITGETTASIGYTVDTTGEVPFVRLQYTVKPSGRDVDYRVRLEMMPVNYGGVRWWFRCPLSNHDRQPCNRRVGKLYLPPGGVYFGCRHCYNLTYTSCNESHKYDSLCKSMAADLGMSPELVKLALKRL